MRYRDKKGFTLIELMVVIAIIGMLASIILVSLNSARVKTNKAKSRQELIQIIRAADLARILKEQTLIGITGNGCSACGSDPAREVAMVASLTNISTKSGIPNLQNLRNDPWGSKYYMDENEAEFNATDCRRDVIYAGGGPDSSTTYNLDYQTTYCKANPVGTAGWQGSF